MFDAYQILPNEGGLDNQDASFVDFMFMCIDRKSAHKARYNKRKQRGRR